jgi:hypothetical protein
MGFATSEETFSLLNSRWEKERIFVKDVPMLLTISDLTERWEMPRQSIHEKKHEIDFPKPIQYVSKGRTALYLESDIVSYEKLYPWICSPEKRRRRQRFIWSLINK